MKEIRYDREEAIKYAKKWVYSRNPAYYNFENIGGDCTSFISQCIYAGCKTMNFNKDNGWYYIDGYNKTPSWSGVEYLYNFLINNKKAGPSGIKINRKDIELGDIIQLKFNKKVFSHSTIVTNINDLEIFITTHSEDVYNKKIDEYVYNDIRYIHIKNFVRLF